LTGNQSDGGDTLNPELLTLNQQTGTDTTGDTTGFTAVASATISSSTEQAYSGSKSLKVVTPNGADNEGMLINATTVVNATAYKGAVWVYAPNGATLILIETASGTHTHFTGTGAWQYVGVDFTSSGTSATLDVYTDGQQGVTFYVDGCRLGKTDTTGFTSYGTGTVVSISPETSYQGLRSLKVTTTSNGTQGMYYNTTTISASTTYTAQVRVKAPLNATLKLYLEPNGNGVATETAITGTGNWEYYTCSITTGSTSSNINVWVRTRSNPQTITFYVDKAMIETGSTAHNWAYGGSSYPLGYTMEQGLLVEESTTNLVSAGISQCNTTTGVGTNGTGVATSVSTDKYREGSSCLKVTTPGTIVGEGVYVDGGMSAGTTYTGSAWIWAEQGVVIKGNIVSGAMTITGNGDWQKINFTYAATSNHALYFLTSGVAQATTFYVDMIQSEAKAYPTSWTIGSSTRQAETCTIPSSVLNIDTSGYSNLLTANQADGTDTIGTTVGWGSAFGDETITSSSAEAKRGNRSLKIIAARAGHGGVSTKITAVASTPFTATFNLKGTGNAKVSLIEYTSADAWVITTYSSTIVLGDWQEVTINKTTHSTTAKLGLSVEAVDAPGITCYVDELQLTATSSARPWIPGGTQVNTGSGTIEVEIYNSTPYRAITQPLLLYLSVIGSNRHYLYRYSNNKYYFYTANNDGSNETSNITDPTATNTWQKVCLRWDKDLKSVCLDGNTASMGTSTTTRLPTGSGTTLAIGNNGSGGQINTLIRNVVVSKNPRSDSEITARASTNPYVDKQVTAVLPLKSNINAYKVGVP
jgi:hypothetical protein